MHLFPATANLIPIVLQTQTRIFHLYPQQILYLKAEHRKVFVYLCNNLEENLPLNISDCLTTLTAHGFFPIHRSYLVNLKYILYFNAYSGVVKLYDGTSLNVAKSRIEQLKMALLKMRKNDK